jgi:hypothetical protein
MTAAAIRLTFNDGRQAQGQDEDKGRIRVRVRVRARVQNDKTGAVQYATKHTKITLTKTRQ